MKVGKGRLVVIIGPDGSGKSSISKSLVEKISSKGGEVDYVWCRFESKLLGFTLRLMSGIMGHKGDFRETYAARNEKKNVILTGTPLKWPYLSFVLFSYMISLHAKVGRPLKKNGIVISDRYVYDTIVDLWVDFGRKDSYLRFLTPMLTNIAPKPESIFWVDVSEEVSMSRKNDVPDIEYVAMRRRGYELISKSIGATKLDGTVPIEVNVESIYNEIR